MPHYVGETFTASEADVLRRYFTNLDGPVFALVNLPEVVKGALFARYSRTHKSLRRLFLDEFVGELDIDRRRHHRRHRRPASGPRSSTTRCSSSTATTPWPSSAASTWPASRPPTCSRRSSSGAGSWPTSSSPPATSPTTPASAAATATTATPTSSARRWAPATSATWTACSTPTPSSSREVQEWCREAFPKDPADSDFVYRQSIRAKALDAVRGILPAASLSNVGIYGTGQGYEALLLRMRAHPLPEARAYADLMLTELRKVIPSFLKRVDRPDRGGAWSRLPGGHPRGHGGGGRQALRRRRARPPPAGHPRRLRPRRPRTRCWRPCSTPTPTSPRTRCTSGCGA